MKPAADDSVQLHSQRGSETSLTLQDRSAQQLFQSRSSGANAVVGEKSCPLLYSSGPRTLSALPDTTIPHCTLSCLGLSYRLAAVALVPYYHSPIPDAWYYSTAVLLCCVIPGTLILYYRGVLYLHVEVVHGEAELYAGRAVPPL